MPANTTLRINPADIPQLVATRAAQEPPTSERRSALTALLAELLDDYRTAAQLVEDADRTLLAAQHGEDQSPVTPPTPDTHPAPAPGRPSYRGGPALDPMFEDEYRLSCYGQADYDGRGW